MIGKRLGNRYEVLALIGSGGMSLVYQAKDIFLDRIVAVKVLREQLTSDDEFIRRFRREAQAAASLSHPNIVNIYDVGQDGDTHYLVMEMIRGRTLKDFIKEHSPLNINLAIDIGKQICDALEHAHENSLVHRDIKPHNILITRGNKVKVTDFGIARAISTATVTHTKGIVGSVHYLSPEQAKGEIAGEKSDIYSLGIVFYEMLTGRLPFEGDTPIGIALKHIQAEAIAPSKYNPLISSDLERVIMKAIAKDPKERYENVRKLRLDLMEALLKKPITPSLSLPVQVDNTEEKGKAEFVNQDTLIFEDEGLILSANCENKDTKTGSPAVKKSVRKLKPHAWILIGLLVLLLIAGIIWAGSKFLIKTEVAVPEVINLSAEEAQRLLSGRGLKMSIRNSVFHPEIEEDHVVSQLPAPETRVKSGRVIEVTLSKGPALVLVPDVIGSPLLIAEVSLSNARLNRGDVTEVFSSEYSRGQVVNQVPGPLESVLENTEVDLVISKGPQPRNVPMPQLVGMELREVEAQLTEAGLVRGDITRQASTLYPKDFVIGQNPSANQGVLEGTRVDLVISDGPGPTARQERVNLRINESGQISIQVKDTTGTRKVYDQYHQQGDAFATVVNYYGQGVITVFKDGTKVSEKVVPSNQ